MKLYVASTSGYSGKTLLALALSRIWAAGKVSVGYVKPLAHYKEETRAHAQYPWSKKY